MIWVAMMSTISSEFEALARIRDRIGEGALASEAAKWILGRGEPIASARLVELCDILYCAERWPELG